MVTEDNHDGTVSETLRIDNEYIAPLWKLLLGAELSLYEEKCDEVPPGFYYLLDADGEVVPTRDRRAVNKLLRKSQKRQIALDTIIHRGHKARVSTIFTVINYGISDESPTLWETMIFSSDKVINEYQVRYKSRQEALCGHEIAVRLAFLRLHRHNVSTKRAKIYIRKLREYRC